MKKHKTNEYVAGHTTQHNIPDIMTKGMSVYLKDSSEETSEETRTTDDNNIDAGEKNILESRLGIEDGDDLDGL